MSANDEDSTSIQPQDDVALERILSMFKPFGPYYRRFMSFLVFTTIYSSFCCTNYVLTTIPVNYRCKYDCERNRTLIGLAFNQTQISGKCHKYTLLNDTGDCSIDNFNFTDIKSCNELIYEDAESFVAEFQLGCQEWKRTLVGTVYNAGYFVGLLFAGPLSDKLGRKSYLLLSGIGAGIIGISKSFSSTYWTYIALEFLEAVIGDAYSPNYMLGVEMVAKQNRVYFGALMTASMSIAGIMFALIAWLVPNWRIMLRVIYAPAFVLILHAIFLDESVRWLLMKGKKEEAKKILKRAAEISNIYIDEETFDRIETKKSKENVGLIKLLKMTVLSRKLIYRFLGCLCIWITGAFNKYAILISSVSLEGNRYVNYAVTASADFPAGVLLVFILIKFKRKGPLIATFLITGFVCVVQSVLPKSYQVLSVILFFIGKMAAAQSFAIVYLYTSELFPTYTRNTMHAVCSSIGRIGSILAPQTPLLRQYWSGLPSVVIGSLSVITGLIVMLMPDTAEDVLPDTIKEAEQLGIKSQDRRVTKELL